MDSMKLGANKSIDKICNLVGTTKNLQNLIHLCGKVPFI